MNHPNYVQALEKVAQIARELRDARREGKKNYDQMVAMQGMLSAALDDIPATVDPKDIYEIRQAIWWCDPRGWGMLRKEEHSTPEMFQDGWRKIGTSITRFARPDSQVVAADVEIAP